MQHLVSCLISFTMTRTQADPPGFSGDLLKRRASDTERYGTLVSSLLILTAAQDHMGWETPSVDMYSGK